LPAAAAAATTTSSDTDATRAKASLFVYDPLALGKVFPPSARCLARKARVVDCSLRVR